MTDFDAPLVTETGVRTVALLADAADLSDHDCTAPSSLPGWSRGHVLAHLTQQAQALTSVLAAAATGVGASMYVSQAARNVAIESASSLPAAEHLGRLRSSADDLATAWRALPDDRLDVEFTAPAGWYRPIRDAIWFRWREVVLHHLDLDVGVADLEHAGPWLPRLLEETVTMISAKPGVPDLAIHASDTGRRWRVGSGSLEVAGTSPALAAWLTGRSQGEELDCDASLPALPAWA